MSRAALVALGAGSTWVRLEFGYDWLGRRISKSFLKGQSDPQAIIDSKGTQMVVWADSWSERFVYEPGGGGWQPSMTYRVDTATGYFSKRGQSFAWGPDMSGTLGGAGGIGGLAVSMEDNSSAPGYGAGPMVPVYDGQGNITRLYTIDFPSFAMASYEYGPFGEVRSITGTQGHRNPFRWSTKWTDAETGLVYYGYRYYAPGMGRWVSRDPIGELGGVNLTAFVHNGPVERVDPTGLRPIPIEFNAFINGARRGHWLPEPGPSPIFPLLPDPRQRVREFSTDWRDFGESNHSLASPNARLMSRATVESSEIGTFKALIAGASAAGFSHRRWSPKPDDPILPDEIDPSAAETARASVSNGAAQEQQWGPKCVTHIRFNPSASYPFIGAAPAINYDVTFILKVERPGWVTISVSGRHDRFPDYEAYGDDILGYKRLSPYNGPGFNLMRPMRIVSGGEYTAWIVSVQAETPCGCPE